MLVEMISKIYKPKYSDYSMSFENLLSKKFKDIIKEDKEIIAVLVFGSYVTNKEYSRDIDICLILDKKYPNLHMTTKRLNLLSSMPSKLDIQIFQQLPLYVRQRILKEGKILICKDEDLLYEIAYMTIKDFNLFERTYRNYLSSVLETEK